MTTVAEGVEEMDLVDDLVRLGCDAIQGYVYSRPCAADEIREWFVELAEGSGAGVRVGYHGELTGNWIG